MPDLDTSPAPRSDASELADSIHDASDLATAFEAVRRGETAVQDLALEGALLVGLDLSGLDLSGANLAGADLSRADLTGARLFGANLRGASLFAARLDGADCTCADFSEAKLFEASFEGAGLGRAKLCSVDANSAVWSGASLTEADLTDADCVGANFTEARLCGAVLDRADVERATFESADLTGTSVHDTRFDSASLRRANVRGLQGFRSASFLHVDTRDTDFSCSYMLREFVQDQNFLHEFRSQGRVQEWTYWLWWLSSDCGRSVTRWSICGSLLALAFAFAYIGVDIDYGPYETPLSPLYFSIVTFTTLGFGDALPMTLAAQVIVLMEVICGYLMLGGLLSLISNKLARRAT